MKKLKPIGEYSSDCDVSRYTIQFSDPKPPKKDDDQGSKYDLIIQNEIISRLQKEVKALIAQRDAAIISRMDLLREKAKQSDITPKERKELLKLMEEFSMRTFNTAREETKLLFEQLSKTQIAMLKTLEDCKIQYEKKLDSYMKGYPNPDHKPTIISVNGRADIKTQQVVTFSFNGSK